MFISPKGIYKKHMATLQIPHHSPTEPLVSNIILKIQHIYSYNLSITDNRMNCELSLIMFKLSRLAIDRSSPQTILLAAHSE